jgi:hypothetical protein
VAELEDAMGAQSTGNLAAPRVTGPISFTLVTTEIDNERPPACRISTRNGHYIAIIATLFNNEDPNNPTEKVTTADPIYGVKEEDYAKLQCIWTDTYHTHKGANKWLSLLPLILRKIFWFFRIQ